MKKMILAVLVACCGFLAGCISIPPLVQVEHRTAPPPPASNQDVIKRLDGIEHRLQRLEEKIDQKE